MWPCIVTCDRASWQISFIIKPTNAPIYQIYFGIKFYKFGTVPPSISRSYSLYTQQWCMSCRYVDSCRSAAAGSGWSSILILLLLESCLQTCMTYTIAECTVNNSCWWTEELSETCRVSFQNKFEKLVHLVGFIIKEIWLYHCQFIFSIASVSSVIVSCFNWLSFVLSPWRWSLR
jgi:hypothetical protein